MRISTVEETKKYDNYYKKGWYLWVIEYFVHYKNPKRKRKNVKYTAITYEEQYYNDTSQFMSIRKETTIEDKKVRISRDRLLK